METTTKPGGLNPPKIQDLAHETRRLAAVANTPDSLLALEELALRYVAEAAGLDTLERPRPVQDRDMSAWRRGRPYPQDLRDRVLSADGIGPGQVAGRLGISASYVVRARQRRDRLGEVTPGAQRSHTPPKLAGHDHSITAQVTRQPDMTLDELRTWILAELGISASISTVWKTLRRLKLTLKKGPLWRRNKPAQTSRQHGRIGMRSHPGGSAVSLPPSATGDR
jgi:transposase